MKFFYRHLFDDLLLTVALALTSSATILAAFLMPVFRATGLIPDVTALMPLLMMLSAERDARKILLAITVSIAPHAYRVQVVCINRRSTAHATAESLDETYKVFI